VWYNVRIPGAVAAATIHELTKIPITLKNGPREVVAATPDTTGIKGACVFSPAVLVNEVDLGPKYLPSPAQIARAGIDYAKYELGTVFGTGTITFAWKEVECRYKLKVGMPVNRITIIGVEPSKDADETLLIFEGELAKGISDTFYIRGTYCIKTPLELTPDAIKRPFCVFQLTPGGTVPEVVSSAMGIRYAALKHKSFTMLSEGLRMDKV
jgi:hypothetical protein